MEACGQRTYKEIGKGLAFLDVFQSIQKNKNGYLVPQKIEHYLNAVKYNYQHENEGHILYLSMFEETKYEEYVNRSDYEYEECIFTGDRST
jgi:hypothetical protein